jgi:outer membrane immunogenic protein
MKNLILAGVGTIGLAIAMQPALAADLPTKGPITRTPVVQVFSWTGFYVGVHVGGGWGRKSQSSAPFTIGPVAITPGASAVDADGWLAGGQVGYNFQGGPGWFGGNWVVGLEAQASWSDIDGDTACSSTAAIPGVGAVTLAATCRAEVDSLGTIALRYGTAYGRTLIYSKFGAAWSRDKYSATPSAAAAGILGITSLNGSENRWGWMSGTGIEFALSDNWSAKAEYNYMNLGTERVRLTSTPAGAAIDSDIKQRMHVVKFGLNYRFGGGAVVAKY